MSVADARYWSEQRGLPWDESVLSDTFVAIPNRVAVWLYFTNSSIVYLDNLISNPKEKLTAGVLTQLVDSVVELARNRGAGYLIAVPQDEDLTFFLRRHGFIDNGRYLVRSCRS